MRIGFDLNGVVINNAHNKTRVAKKYFGAELPIENTVLNTLDNKLPLEIYEKLQDIVYGTSEMLVAPPVSMAAQVRLAQLMKRHEIFLVTRIQPPGVQFARQWLRERWLDPHALVSVGPGGDKKRVLQHDFQVYVDDDPEQLEALASVVPHLFLFDTLYNHNYQLSEHVTRVYDWQELDERMTELASRQEPYYLCSEYPRLES